jgi:hypothetical protein
MPRQGSVRSWTVAVNGPDLKPLNKAFKIPKGLLNIQKTFIFID